MPNVVVKSKEGSKTYPLPEGKPLFIGRAKDCDIVLPSPAVSRRHAVIVFKNGICGVKDLGSFNGTVVNGQTIAQPAHLREEDVVKISTFQIRVAMREESPAAAPAAEQPKGKSPKPDSRVFTSKNMLLPRAMSAADDVDALITAIPSNASQRLKTGDSGPDTAIFGDTANTRIIPNNDVPDDSPAATQYEIPPPLIEAQSVAAASVDADGSINPNDTNYFEEESLKELLQRRWQEEKEAAEREAAAPPETVSEETLHAEEIIPLLEPEAAPVLTLETDPTDPTIIALEKLIEDSDESAEPIQLPPPPAEPVAEKPPETDEFKPVEAPEPLPPVDEDEFGGPTERPSQRTTAKAFATGFRHVPGGVDAVGVSPALMAAINARLGLYSLLFDLSDERKALRMAYPNMSAELQRELDRQDAEIDCLPATEQAEVAMTELRARQEADEDADEPRKSVEEMAYSQWLLIRDSNRQSLPPIFKEAYKLAADEPLALDLSAAKIPHGRLLGGAIYLLALQTLAQSAESERKSITTRLRRLSEEGTERSKSSVLSKFGKIGRLANKFKNRDEIRKESAKLAEETRVNDLRAGLAMREIAYMEKALIREFRQLYMKIALHFIPKHETMPFSIRAFLRHGAIGFKRWWMRDEVREFILTDCKENVVTSFERGSDALNVLYIDEYIAAVSQMECSPSPDERLAALDKSADEWKADRAYRRIVNARTYNVLMEEMLLDLDSRIKALDAESEALESKMQDLKARPFAGGKDSMFDLQTEHQAVAIRRGNLEKHIKRIETEVVASIIEAVQEAEGRFRKGELKMPDEEQLITLEVESLFEAIRRMEGQRERFMPLVIRDHYTFKNEILNDRATIRKGISDCEQLDPGLFMNTIIAAKKRINRVEMRLGPTVVLMPALGLTGICSLPRGGMEGGHLLLPICFGRENMRKRLLANLLADFRWETARQNAGRDVLNSDTLVGAFMRIRWEWRNQSKAKREKGLVLNELTDQMNWRRVYELYLSDAMTGCRQLFLRNPDCYFAIIEKYIDLPEGVRIIRKSGAGGDEPLAAAEGE